jgi:hypothetical protein
MYDWQCLMRIKKLKDTIVYNILDCGGIIYGGYVRDQQRYRIKMEYLDDPTKELIKSKMYNSEIDPESWYWRMPNRLSDIDCVMTKSMFEKWKNMQKLYIIEDINNLVDYRNNANYFYSIVIEHKYKTKAIAFHTKKILLDITIIKDNSFDKFVTDLGECCDFDINSLIITKDLKNKNIDSSFNQLSKRIINEPECEFLYITNAFIFSSISSSVNFIKNINKNLLEDTAECNDLDISGMNRIYSILNRYKRIIISYKGNSPIYFIRENNLSYCNLCDNCINLSMLSILVNNKKYHINCYINKIFKVNKNHLNLIIIDNKRMTTVKIKKNIKHTCEYTFDNIEDEAYNICKLYNISKSCELI